MSPIVAYHATRRACRESIQRLGLLPNQPTKARPYGVYVFRDDGGFDHPGRDSRIVWTTEGYADLWQVSYIGRMMIDQYVLNGMILLDTVDHVTLVSGNMP